VPNAIGIFEQFETRGRRGGEGKRGRGGKDRRKGERGKTQNRPTEYALGPT